MLLAARGDQPALPRYGIGLHVEERVIGVELPAAQVAHLGVLPGCVIPIVSLVCVCRARECGVRPRRRVISAWADLDCLVGDRLCAGQVGDRHQEYVPEQAAQRDVFNRAARAAEVRAQDHLGWPQPGQHTMSMGSLPASGARGRTVDRREAWRA